MASAEAGDVAQELCDGRFDVVVFTSPSTFQKLVEAGRDRGLEVLAGLARRIDRKLAAQPVFDTESLAAALKTE